MDFSITLSNVLVTLIYILPGFIVCKLKRAVVDHLSTLSGVLVYGCAPCMVISSFLKLKFSIDDLINMGWFFLVTFVLQAAFMGLIYGLLHRKVKDARYRVLTIGSVLGNVGFFGLPVVKALLPGNDEVMCYSAVYVITMNILVFTVGVFCLTGDKRYMTLKAAIFNPSMFGFVTGLLLYVLRVGEGIEYLSKAEGVAEFVRILPQLTKTSLNLLGEMTTPLCMIILGVRLATVSFKRLFSRPTVYLVCLGKLVLFPLFCYAAVYFLPLDHAFKASVLILSATPCASVVFNLAEMHKSEAELSANCVLLSTLLCFLTIPVLTLLL